MSIAVNGVSLEPGAHLTLTVSGLAYGGEGIAKHQGMVVFIPEALPGDVVEVKVLQVKKRFARAELVRLQAAGPDRVEPFCPVASECGGCSWQHLSYPGQLRAKQNFIENSLVHVARLAGVLVEPVIKAPHQQAYRHKIQIPFQASAQGFVAGFFAKQTHRVVPIEECPVQPALGNKLFRVLRELAQEYGLQGYDEVTHSGQLRHAVLRCGLHTHEALVILVTRTPEVPRIAELAQALQAAVPELVGVVQNINPELTNVILGPSFKVLTGRDHLYEEVRGLRYRISAGSFFQVNPYQMPIMAESVIAAAGLTGSETVVDLFCGVGFLTLELARKAHRAFGVESVETSIADAQANKLLNQFANVEFMASEAGVGVQKLRATGMQPEVVVLDPPRKGCEPGLLRALTAWRPKRVVYVSCNPITLARDAALLVAGGYRLQQVQPLDLFPQTYHVEAVAGFVSKK